jgi:tetratricopeptide (TPR) repeat protein
VKSLEIISRQGWVRALVSRVVPAFAVAALALTLAGCASLFPAAEGSEDASSPPERADAPAEYDVLVGQHLETEGRLIEASEAYLRAVAKDPSAPYLNYKVAQLLARTGRLEEAQGYGVRALELAPDHLPTRMFMGQLHRMRRDTAAAERVLRGEDGEPIDITAAALLYQIYLETDRLGDAQAIAEWWLDAEPDSPRAGLALANVYQRLERPLDSEAVLRSLVDRFPENLRLYGVLARSLRERGDHDGEIKIYLEVLDLHPNHLATLQALAQAQMSIDDLEGAMATLEQIERRYPEDLRSIARLAYLKYEAREFDEAALRFERVLAANPEEYEIAFFLGVVQRRSGEIDAAVSSFLRIPPEHRYYAEARTQLASIYERRGQYDKALSEIGFAAAAQPARSLDLYAATLRSKTGDFDGAVDHLELLLRQAPEDDELLYNLGVIHGEADRPEEAVGYMERALAINPENAAALNYIGYTWAEQGLRLDDAEEMIERAIELRPDDGYIVDSLGWVYYMRALPLVESGRRIEANEYLQRALKELYRADELTGGDPVVSEHLGDTYLLLEEKRRALEKFEEALRLAPRENEQPNLHEKLESLRLELH